MPAKSEAQRAYLYATKGKKWVEEHHFNTKGKLPKRVKPKAKKTKKRGKR